MAIGYGNMLDVAAINAKVLFEKSTGKILSRRNFVLQLIEDLRMEKVSFANVAATYSSIDLDIPRKCRTCRGTRCNNVHMHHLQEINLWHVLLAFQ